MKRKRSFTRMAGILSVILLLTMTPLNGLALDGTIAENTAGSLVISAGTTDAAEPAAGNLVISAGTTDAVEPAAGNLSVSAGTSDETECAAENTAEAQGVVSVMGVTKEGYVDSSRTGGTITGNSESGGTITGTVRVDAGYDLATVRYQHSDGSYDLADLTKTPEGYTFSIKKTAAGTELIPEFFSTTVWDGAVDLSWYDRSQSEFYLSTPAQAAGLAALVNGMTDQSLPAYRVKGDLSVLVTHQIDNFQLTGAGGGNQYATVFQADAVNDFAGKTVYLTADLDMGGICDEAGNWSGPNWTPIGGKYPLEPSTGEYLIEAFFNGVLDGQGHQIKNLYCNRFTEKGYAYSQAIGFVGYLGSEYEDETLPEGWQPAVRNLTVAGDVYGRRMVAGVVGRLGGADNGVIIENCANFANVRNTDSKGVGGICGAGWGTGIIRNCYNRGNISTLYPCPTGGICGSNGGMDIYNCYSTGTVTSNGNKRGRGIGSHESGSYIVDNCYYLEGCGDDPDHPGYFCGTALNIKVETKGMTASELKSSDLIKSLNCNGEVFVRDTTGINDGYPVLYYQVKGYDNQTMHTVHLDQSSGGTLSMGGELTVPHGTVIELTATPAGGYIFQNYTVNGQDFTGDFYTVVSDVTISARFSVMKKGTAVIKNGTNCTVSLRKNGTIMKSDGSAEAVSRYQVKSEDPLFEGDSLTASAHLNQGAEPADPTREYTGAFRYTFTYGNTNSSTNEKGTHKVSSQVQEETLTVTAEPLTRVKNWSALADTSWYTGENDRYSIQSAEQLAGLAELVNKGTDFSGVTISLAGDISLKNSDGTGTIRQWAAIGSGSAYAFKGTFDGNGYTVSNMTAVSTGSYSGLFGYCTGAVIRNVTVKGTSKAQGSAAGIAGHLSGGTVTDCVSRVKVTSTDQYAAGIAAGISDGASIRNSINFGSISGTTSVAGIIGGSGQLTDRISDCVNYGAITGSSSQSGGTAGIAGTLGGTLIRCANYGEITGNGWYTGGLVGHTGSADTTSMDTSVIRDSYNQGSVSSSNKTKNAAVGGLIGYAQYINLSNCYNAGAVTLVKDSVSSYCGSATGRFYRSVYNHVKDVCLLNGTCVRAMDVDDTALDYVQIKWMEKSGFASVDYCTEMNSLAGDSCFVAGAYPELLNLKKNVQYTVRYTGDYTGTQTVYAGNAAELPQAPDGEQYAFTVNDIPWDGANVVSDLTVQVVKTAAVHTVSFYADGCQIAVETYQKGETTVAEPAVPEKEGFEGSWPSYQLDGTDLRVDAVYSGNVIYGGSTIAKDGVYCLAADASGTITVAAGVNVTLEGGGTSEVQLVLEKGASAVLRNVRTSYNGSVLVLKGNNTLEIRGDNRLTGASSVSNNPDPTILAEGAVTFTGSGTLYADAQSGNAVMQIGSGVEVTVDGPKVECYKNERLGIDGGVINGQGSLRLNSGVLASYSNSDNLFAVSIGSFTQTGGSAIFMCDDHEHSIRTGSITLSGGSFRARGRSHEDPSVYYQNAEAVECTGFAGSYHLTEVSVETTGAPYTIKTGSTTSIADGAYDTVLADDDEDFTLIPGKTLYVWTRNGSTPSVKGTDNAGYSAMISGSTINVLFTGEVPANALIAAASFREDGSMIDYVSADAAERASLDINLNEASVVRIFVLTAGGDRTPLGPAVELAL